MIFLHVMIMVIALIMELANVMEASTVTVAQVNMILCYWCFHLVVCHISWFFWPKHVRITYNWIEFKLTLQKDMYHKNRIYLQKFLSFLQKWYQKLWQQSNILVVFLISKKNVLVSTIQPTELELFIKCNDFG